jgi:hypothetical protein
VDAFQVLFAAATVVALGGSATAQVAILQIQVIDGEGAVHAPGSRSARPLTVEVTDETGRPIDGAVVSFHMPEEGPSGTFGNSLRTSVVTTDAKGHASARGMQFNRAAGRFQIRILASKEQVRAGIVSFQYISGAASAVAPLPPGAPARAVTMSTGGHRGRWIAVAALAGGGAVAAVLVAGRSGASSASTTTVTPALTIGTPSITVGHP